MAAANPGPYYSPPLVDQLFDNFPWHRSTTPKRALRARS